MKTEELRVKAYDKISLYAKFWYTNENPDGVILLVHGLGEHINRYNHWAKRFNNAGWAVAGIDLRGHGQSEGKRGSGNYYSYLKDINSLFKIVSKKFGDIPKVLYGHSMGGNLALGYEISRKPEISKLIVTSPWLKLSNPPSTPLIGLSKFLGKIYPSLSFSNGVDVQSISRDKEVCHNYKTDPLVHNRISVNTFLQIQEWAMYILKNKHKIAVPLLLLHGREDKITSWKGSFMFSRGTSDNTLFKIWENCYHELHNEICNEEVFNFISGWLGDLQNVKKVHVG
jgi:alpha-beta hydrolase superfamily lysophospholipase